VAAISRALPELRGKRRLALWLMDRVEARGSLRGTWSLTLKDGTRLELPRQSLMSWWVAFTGTYDPDIVARVAEFVQPDSLVLDVGASLGLWTVQLGKIAAARGARLWAFEPNPANTPWIERNVALNVLGDTVTANEFGLGDKAESSILVGVEYGVGNGTIMPARNAAGQAPPASEKHPRIPITLRRIDEIELPAPVSFIKLDVEGFEPAFMRGATELIERDRPVIFGEFAPRWLTARGEELGSVLAGLDYDVDTLIQRRGKLGWRGTGLEIRPLDLEGPRRLHRNLLLRPRERAAA
jgi:FkbM family methyltransferase